MLDIILPLGYYLAWSYYCGTAYTVCLSQCGTTLNCPGIGLDVGAEYYYNLDQQTNIPLPVSILSQRNLQYAFLSYHSSYYGPACQ
jgi:hypothetical protein